jgi:hypothetical protein
VNGTFYDFIKCDKILKSRKSYFSSFRRKPESSLLNSLPILWTPVFTGVTTFTEFIKM